VHAQAMSARDRGEPLQEAGSVAIDAIDGLRSFSRAVTW
jgi:hypothetical protein